jgi:hypothetical protein
MEVKALHRIALIGHLYNLALLVLLGASITGGKKGEAPSFVAQISDKAKEVVSVHTRC